MCQVGAAPAETLPYGSCSSQDQRRQFRFFSASFVWHTMGDGEGKPEDMPAAVRLWLELCL